jgi:hypothetical protein
MYNQKIQNISLSKNLYAKYLLRCKKSKELGLIDLNSDFSNAYVGNRTNSGESIYYNIKNFKHRNYKELRLKTFLPFSQLSNSYQQATYLDNSINSITNPNVNNFVNILNPTKGGFYGHYFGIYGFIPKSQLRHMISKTLKSNLPEKKDLPNHIFFSNLHNNNSWLKPRTNFNISKISITPYSITNNFVMRKKRKIFKSKLNFVFITK